MTRLPVEFDAATPLRLLLLAVALVGSCLATTSWAADATCRATSTTPAPTVIELYTSEGCSSCPPADRWLSRLKGRADVVPLAFHVTYWDRLGWPDRFASPDYTARQHEAATRAGRAQVYTPQVMSAGRDWPSWNNWPGNTPLPSARAAAAAKAAVLVQLQREGDKVTAQVQPLTVGADGGAAPKLSGYFVVVEDNHTSQVKSGENAGETLRHDHVVRLLRPVPAWAAAQGTQATLTVNADVPAHPRRVVFVVQDAATQLPLQAVVLGC
jgi:hypothetical protein